MHATGNERQVAAQTASITNASFTHSTNMTRKKFMRYPPTEYVTSRPSFEKGPHGLGVIAPVMKSPFCTFRSTRPFSSITVGSSSMVWNWLSPAVCTKGMLFGNWNVRRYSASGALEPASILNRRITGLFCRFASARPSKL